MTIVWQRSPRSSESHPSDSLFEYRIEERRRVLIVKSPISPDKWDEKTFQQISQLAMIPDDQGWPSREKEDASAFHKVSQLVVTSEDQHLSPRPSPPPGHHMIPYSQTETSSEPEPPRKGDMVIVPWQAVALHEDDLNADPQHGNPDSSALKRDSKNDAHQEDPTPTPYHNDQTQSSHHEDSASAAHVKTTPQHQTAVFDQGDPIVRPRHSTPAPHPSDSASILHQTTFAPHEGDSTTTSHQECKETGSERGSPVTDHHKGDPLITDQHPKTAPNQEDSSIVPHQGGPTTSSHQDGPTGPTAPSHQDDPTAILTKGGLTSSPNVNLITAPQNEDSTAALRQSPHQGNLIIAPQDAQSTSHPNHDTQSSANPVSVLGRRKNSSPGLELKKRQSQSNSPQRASSVSRTLGSSPPPAKACIYFYDANDPFYDFTNFSLHPVDYHGKIYPTSEHLFQSFKEHRPLLAEHIRTISDKPSIAFSEARRFKPEVRQDWMKVNVTKMDETLRYKFDQHQDLKQELLDTGDVELIEDSDQDSFWGVGGDRKGRNELGKALERLRGWLRAEQMKLTSS